MTAALWDEFKASTENLKAVRKTLGAVLAFAPEDAPVPGPLTTDGIRVNELPPEYTPVGLLAPDGVTAERDVTNSEVEALGHFSPVREDPESASRTISLVALEVLNRQVVELSEGIDLSEAEVNSTSGELVVDIPDVPNVVFYRALLITFDGSIQNPHFSGRFWPRVSVNSFPSETFNKSDPRQAEIGLRAYPDPALGFIVRRIEAGLGFLDVAADLGYTIGA